MNSTAKVVGSIVLVVLLLVGIRVGVGLANQPDDQKLIREALQESIKASKEGRPGGVMDLLSTNLRVNDTDTSMNRGQIARFIKDSRPDVIVENQQALITGDEARIVSPVDLEVNMLGQSMKRRMDEVTLIFKKEDDRQYLIFPARKWKLAEVRVPDSALADLMQG